MGDLNIDIADKTKDTCNYLYDICDTFYLTYIINGKTCFKAQKGTRTHTLHVFLLKLSNIEITKTLMKRFLSMTLIRTAKR